MRKHDQKQLRNRLMAETRRVGDAAWTRYQEAEQRAMIEYRESNAPIAAEYRRVKAIYDATIARSMRAYEEAMAEAKADYVNMTGSPLRGKVRLP